MIKHELRGNQIHLSISNVDFSYRIPLNKIVSIATWKIGEKGNNETIVFKNVSKWTLKLFTKNVTDEYHIEKFRAIIKEYVGKSNIDWAETLIAVKAQNRYNWLTTNNAQNKNALTETEILMAIKEKYKLDY